MKKLTYEFVYNYFKENNCELLDKQYINAYTKMKYICKCKQISFVRYKDFKSGTRCKSCKINNLKSPITYISDYYNKFGYKLKSNYINALTKDSLICPSGHEIEMRFNNFKRGQRCSHCLGLKNFTHEFVKSYLNKYSYELLDELFINTHSKISIKCPNNHIYKVTFDSFKNNNARCKQCYFENNIGENHHSYNPDRTTRSRTKYLTFKLYNIEKLNDDPNYENYLMDNKLYNVDHIFPRKAFIDNNLDEIYGTQLIKEICNSRDNLRIINSKENKSKSAKYNQDEFINWFNIKIQGFKNVR